MTAFLFTDNRGLHRHTLSLSAAQLAKHLSADAQFMFYWLRGIDGRLNALRSLYVNPPHRHAVVCPEITEADWEAVDAELKAMNQTTHAE